MDTQQELSPPSTQPATVNLQDLQSYLVTFNKEIEPNDQNTFQVCSCKSFMKLVEIIYLFESLITFFLMKKSLCKK